jgi:hypothetical protein
MPNHSVFLELTDTVTGVEATIEVSGQTAHDAIHADHVPTRDAARTRICSAFFSSVAPEDRAPIQLLRWADIEPSVEEGVLCLHPTPSLLMTEQTCGQMTMAC